MKSTALVRLLRLLGVARSAEAARLGGVLAEIAGCRGRARRFRAEIAAPEVAARRGDAAEMAAAACWSHRLAERARAEDARAAVLEAEAEALRQKLARTTGRESAVAAMVEKARAEERRVAARRTEAAGPAPKRAADQSSASGSGRSDCSAGSPGIA